MTQQAAPLPVPAVPDTRPRRNAWNAVGVWSLYRREVMRFAKIYLQTFIAPMITALLFFAIFQLAFEGQGRSMGDVPFANFLVPGLTLMAVMTSAFGNASFAMMFEKIVQTIVDTLLPPLTANELVAGYILSSTTRGVLVGLTVGLSMSIFTPVEIHHWGFIIFHAVAAASFMSALGLSVAIWADKIDHVASINNFAILPLTFLSGTFYSIQHLPGPFQTIAQFNPFFYMIDGFRYGFIGVADGNLTVGLVIMTVLNLVLWLFCRQLLHSGYKLKS